MNKNTNNSPKTTNEKLQYNQNYLNTNIKNGLDSSEVKKRQEEFGKNALEQVKKQNWFLAYLSQFKDVLVIILLAATLFSYVLAIVKGVQENWVSSAELTVSFIEPTIILFVVLTNSLIGAIQEIKSSQAIEALKKLTPLQAKVIRDGNLITINAEDITIGDVVLIESGDVVPADGFLLQASNLSMIESSLTGESEPTKKDHTIPRDLNLPIAERPFQVFSSSIVATGTGYMVVSEIGKNTELGKISSLVSTQTETISPLQHKIGKLGKIFGFAGIALFFLSTIMQIIFQAISKSSFANTTFWATTIINGISLAVAAIPEGLIAFTSIILAIGIQRMAKRKAIVKNLMAVESLGSCSVICSDKTGTLTQNKMTVVNLFANGLELSLSKWNDENFLELVEYGALCTEANLINENNSYKEAGDPTEIALLYMLEKHSNFVTKKELEKAYPRLLTLPFDSDRKLMTTINKINNKNIVIVKGAPDILINRCNNISTEDNKKILQINDQWSNKAYRVIALAKSEISEDNLSEVSNATLEEQYKKLESNLTFIGLIAMIDPPRESSRQSIELCKAAGIKPIMITGDNINTARAIATDLGIYNEGDLAINGLELAKLSDDELYENIEKYSVYARVVPEDKLRIVRAWQRKYQVVAMTGDGVNDAPALKAADIGCAMGITGTEASKQAADMILSDDNFSTVVHAVENGRSVYQKIKNVIQNLLITSIAEIVLVFFGLIIFKAIFNEQINALVQINSNFEFYILGATQLLWINLFTHGFPAIALGLQDSKDNYMNKRPISKYESIFARGMGWNTLWQGLLIGILSLVGYYLGAIYAINIGSPENFVKAGSTVAFLILGITATFNAINLMTKKPAILSSPLYYWKVYCSVIFSLTFLLLVSFIKPIANVFKIADLASHKMLMIYSFALPLIIIPIYLIHKLIVLYYDKKHNTTNKIVKFELILPPKQKSKSHIAK
ncbi:Calcium-transporting ATPase lmo0841 [Metamycoplasma arthritidis]|uniref:Cation-transporting P-type ATPase n=1 Tax=Metamycoplasma arthritidis (strain 158L3-1) TaxID=243272 RepID=B3PLU1_META1|nr:cation-transporting P-type ATPase [Metamycoplasma arthritidis]ACF06993.1 cation-transporting P-type ATPase [Metamycoplasma arthritidis 158L3-1]VEU78522.1 Calcium-transporting ATPase lmo0841 [Metamycoplasma arthritidis]